MAKLIVHRGERINHCYNMLGGLPGLGCTCVGIREPRTLANRVPSGSFLVWAFKFNFELIVAYGMR